MNVTADLAIAIALFPDGILFQVIIPCPTFGTRYGRQGIRTVRQAGYFWNTVAATFADAKFSVYDIVPI